MFHLERLTSLIVFKKPFFSKMAFSLAFFVKMPAQLQQRVACLLARATLGDPTQINSILKFVLQIV
jgi:hypothetical protein